MTVVVVAVVVVVVVVCTQCGLNVFESFKSPFVCLKTNHAI